MELGGKTRKRAASVGADAFVEVPLDERARSKLVCDVMQQKKRSSSLGRLVRGGAKTKADETLERRLARLEDENLALRQDLAALMESVAHEKRLRRAQPIGAAPEPPPEREMCVLL